MSVCGETLAAPRPAERPFDQVSLSSPKSASSAGRLTGFPVIVTADVPGHQLSTAPLFATNSWKTPSSFQCPVIPAASIRAASCSREPLNSTSSLDWMPGPFEPDWKKAPSRFVSRWERPLRNDRRIQFRLPFRGTPDSFYLAAVPAGLPELRGEVAVRRRISSIPHLSSSA